MKFGETLSTHLTPEWRKQYISYSILRQMIFNAIANIPPDVDRSSSAYKAYLAKFDDEFFQECEKELLKIDTFFAEKLAEAKRKFREFSTEVQFYTKGNANKRNLSHLNLSDILPKRKTRELKLALSEYYLSLILLQNYQKLNHTGFRKILKKHDKKLNLENGVRWFKSIVESAAFAENQEVQSLIEKTEMMFTNNLENGNRSRAMKYLRVPPFEEQQSPMRTFRIGFALGIFTCLFCFLCFSITLQRLSKLEYESYIRLHRGPLLLILYIFLIGINIHGWQKAGVNHILIFEIDPRDHLTGIHLLEIASYFGVLWAISFLACLHVSNDTISPHIFPSVLAFLMLLYWLNPAPLQRKSRYWLMKVVGRIISAPFYEVGFADFWLADQLNSLTIAFIDYEYILCCCFTKLWYKSSDPFSCFHNIGYVIKAIVYSLPAWWRLAQSLRRYYDTRLRFPFLVNAGKYASTFPVAGFGAALQTNKETYNRTVENPYFWCFVLCRIINTTYCYSWDILMDFGLFKKNSGENIFLREEIIYSPIAYYLAIIEDLMLRLFWVPVIIFEEFKLIENIHITTLEGIAEVIRRYIWNYFRLEHEHLNNAGHFRAVRDISVKLVMSDDSKRIEPIMDRRDGIFNRRSKRRESMQSDED